MEEYLMNDGVFLFQLICAGLCGMAVGIERQSRMKSAGVRTHFVVAMASALMMIVSKYGFLDVISINGARVDVSRVAAGIISGIGILGGGLIFIGKQGLVSGMTTAAGIWMTVGIGMAMGARMYVLGFEGTILILLMQYLFHRKFTIFKEPLRAQTMFMVDDEREEYVLFFLTVYVEVGNAVAEVVCHTVQFRVCGSKCVQSAQQLVPILACVPVMELQNIVDKQVEVPCLKGNCRFK